MLFERGGPVSQLNFAGDGQTQDGKTPQRCGTLWLVMKANHEPQRVT